MSKKQVIAYVAIFNALIIAAFIFSNLYMWDLFNTQINKQGGRQAHDFWLEFAKMYKFIGYV